MSQRRTPRTNSAKPGFRHASDKYFSSSGQEAVKILVETLHAQPIISSVYGATKEPTSGEKKTRAIAKARMRKLSLLYMKMGVPVNNLMVTSAAETPSSCRSAQGPAPELTFSSMFPGPVVCRGHRNPPKFVLSGTPKIKAVRGDLKLPRTFSSFPPVPAQAQTPSQTRHRTKLTNYRPPTASIRKSKAADQSQTERETEELVVLTQRAALTPASRPRRRINIKTVNVIPRQQRKSAAEKCKTDREDGDNSEREMLQGLGNGNAVGPKGTARGVQRISIKIPATISWDEVADWA